MAPRTQTDHVRTCTRRRSAGSRARRAVRRAPAISSPGPPPMPAHALCSGACPLAPPEPRLLQAHPHGRPVRRPPAGTLGSSRTRLVAWCVSCLPGSLHGMRARPGAEQRGHCCSKGPSAGRAVNTALVWRQRRRRRRRHWWAQMIRRAGARAGSARLRSLLRGVVPREQCWLQVSKLGPLACPTYSCGMRGLLRRGTRGGGVVWWLAACQRPGDGAGHSPPEASGRQAGASGWHQLA